MNTRLHTLIDEALIFHNRAAHPARPMNPRGFYVAFSGGKDSQVLLDLVRRSGLPHEVHHNVTTVDAADNIRFIRQHYPDVIFDRPDTSFLRLVASKGLPTTNRRWCCDIFKEVKGYGFVVLTGVRAEESVKRSRYNEVNIWQKSRDKRIMKSLEEMEQVHFECIKGKDKLLMYPLLRWKESDIWDYIREFDLPVNPCYHDRGRVGCMVCPFCNAKMIRKYLQDNPKYKSLLVRALDENIKLHGESVFQDGNDLLQWWLSHKTIAEYMADKRQLSLF